MTRRFVLATVYTVFVAALLLTWPWGTAHRPVFGDESVITSVPLARWLLIFTPFYWGWAALHVETKSARRIALAASVALFVACLLLVSYSDNARYVDCLWHSGHCGPGWFYWYD